MAIAIQSLWIPIDADVSWLLTVSERVLSGDGLYVDILEVNPPASVWLYLPLVWLAHLVDVRPEAVVVAAFIAASLASVLATVRLACRLDDAPRPVWLTAILSFILLVLPMGLFAQREHAALILAFPALAGIACLPERKAVGTRTLLALGFAAGLVIDIKPVFVFAILAPAAWAAWKRQSLAPFLAPAAAAATAMLLYGAAVLLFARSYLGYLPVIAHTYAPMHFTLWKVLVGPVMFPATSLALAFLLRPKSVPALAVASALSSSGFVLAAIIQAKNYPNHWFPGEALALAAALLLLAMPNIARSRRMAVGAALGFVAVCEMYSWLIRPDPAVAAAVVRVAPASPSMIALGTELTTGHPLTRNVGGEWVGSSAALFTAAGARFVGLDDPIALQAYRADLQQFATDVREHSPDVILVDERSKTWLMREPVIARVMSGYRPAAQVEKTEIWTPRGR
ncbi:MAG TPA: hypothetical protein VFI88_07905 [Sphingomicrobium sp.]|nr:hypothetical protein [Sphingomicrobium sp.]